MLLYRGLSLSLCLSPSLVSDTLRRDYRVLTTWHCLKHQRYGETRKTMFPYLIQRRSSGVQSMMSEPLDVVRSLR